jgi:hypothetical protein
MDGFGDKIGGFVLEAANRQVHVTVPRNHHNLGIGDFLLDAPQQLDAVHHRHLDVGNHDGRTLFQKEIQSLPAVFGLQNIIARIGQRKSQHVADVLFVIHQQDGVVAGRCVKGAHVGSVVAVGVTCPCASVMSLWEFAAFTGNVNAKQAPWGSWGSTQICPRHSVTMP